VMNTFANSTGSYVTIFAYPLSNTSTSSPSTETTLSHSNSSVSGIYRISTNGTLDVSVRYYYYNSTAVNEFNFSGGQQFFVYGFSQQKMTPATDFTVMSNVSTVSMGGPQNRSEGIPALKRRGITLSKKTSLNICQNHGKVRCIICFRPRLLEVKKSV
jgi:hypothetical protein